jgi:vacuolar protein sorting-associated protein 13A/C
VAIIEKPVEGLISGPVETGLFCGILEGAGSLMKNTIEGTFNTIEKITGSLSSGIATVSMVNFYYFLLN